MQIKHRSPNGWVKEEEYLKKALALSGLAWLLMAALGSALGGFVVV
jgi:hypothetical protein